MRAGSRKRCGCSGTAARPCRSPEIVAYAFAIAFGVRYVLVKAWYAARRLRPDINLLMVIAIAGAIGIGEWFEAATVAFLFALSLTLESWSVGRARRAISALLDLSPPTVRALSATGEEREIAAAEAPVGTRFIVRPGERIALDGRVVVGTSAVDQSPITGESVPVGKEPGGEVFAGTINGDGALEVESTKVAEDTTLARITRMVERGAQPARPGRAVGREVRPRVHARGDRARARHLRGAAVAVRRGVGRLVLPGARPAGDRLPLCARDLDAGEHRGGARRLRPGTGC